MELGLTENNELGWVVSLEGKQTVMASYWSVSNENKKFGGICNGDTEGSN